MAKKQMKFTRHEQLNSERYIELANNILTGRANRAFVNMKKDLEFKPNNLSLFMDGPVIFAIAMFENKTYTGWSKFNPKDEHFSTKEGVVEALRKLTDAVIGTR